MKNIAKEIREEVEKLIGQLNGLNAPTVCEKFKNAVIKQRADKFMRSKIRLVNEEDNT